MRNRSVHFTRLTTQDLASVRAGLAALKQRTEGTDEPLAVRLFTGSETLAELPSSVKNIIIEVIDELSQGRQVAVVTDEDEVSPQEASRILGISRPLVVLRMDKGDLPFRYVGAHRRALLKDVLDLKGKLQAQREAMTALLDDSEDLYEPRQS